MITAGEAIGIAAARGHRVAAVRAHVEERAHAAVALAGEQQRHTGNVHRLVIARIGQLARRRDHQRQAAEDLLLLALEQRLVGIGRGGNAHNLVGEFHRPGIAMGDKRTGHFDQLFT